MNKTQCPFDIELHREIWEQGYKAGAHDERAADAEIIAELFGPPCDFSPIDEELVTDDYCEHNCGIGKEIDAKCWLRYLDIRRTNNERSKRR